MNRVNRQRKVLETDGVIVKHVSNERTLLFRLEWVDQKLSRNVAYLDK